MRPHEVGANAPALGAGGRMPGRKRPGDRGQHRVAGITSPPCDPRGPALPLHPMLILQDIISDRGSRYAVSGAPCADEGQAKALLKDLKRAKKFARATHNSWGLIGPDGPVKSDDGEAGAGAIILRMLETAGLSGHLIVVTRWYGGKHLGGDRFRHVQEAVRLYLAEIGA